MASVLAWLDYSEDDRRRMREVIDLFREQDTLDELGIGSIRDTFADRLFPGISTVQTRAAYFLFVPWVYLDLERRRVPAQKAAVEARRLELALIGALETGGAEGGQGVIGWEARDHLKRLPSSVYWGGLGAFHIRRFHGSIQDYHRSLDAHYRRVSEHTKGEGDEVHQRFDTNWHPALPEPPEDLFESTRLDLRATDAAFLRDQIITSRSESLLANLLRQSATATGTDFPWEAAEARSIPHALSDLLGHARLFSETIHGAALTFNLMLARLAVDRGMSGRYADLADEYESRLIGWAAELGENDRIRNWEIEEFWRTALGADPRIGLLTKQFIDRWIELARHNRDAIVSLDQRVQQLIAQRERQLKRGQSRLHNHRALERWGGSSGLARLDYRWNVARRIIADIREGQRDARA